MTLLLCSAEGRLLSAIEHSEDLYALGQSFGSRESWEVSSSGYLASSHFKTRVFNAQPQLVTALPTAYLSQWEHEKEILMVELLNKLDAQAKEAAEADRRSSELIKAGHHTSANCQREIDNLRKKLETTSRLALHWQEDAALSAKALAAAERELQHHNGVSSCHVEQQQSDVDSLRTQMQTLQEQHQKHVQNLEITHKRELEQARTRNHENNSISGISYVEFNALHQELVTVQAEKARLESALQCIKEMMRHSQTAIRMAHDIHHLHTQTDDIQECCDDIGGDSTGREERLIRHLGSMHPEIDIINNNTIHSIDSHGGGGGADIVVDTTATDHSGGAIAVPTISSTATDNAGIHDNGSLVCDVAVGIPVEDTFMRTDPAVASYHNNCNHHQEGSASGSSFSLQATTHRSASHGHGNAALRPSVSDGASASPAAAEAIIPSRVAASGERCNSALSYHSCDETEARETTTCDPLNGVKCDPEAMVTPENSTVHGDDEDGHQGDALACDDASEMARLGSMPVHHGANAATPPHVTVAQQSGGHRAGSVSAPSSVIKSEKVQTTAWAAGSLSLPGSRLGSPLSTTSNADDTLTRSSIPDMHALRHMLRRDDDRDSASWYEEDVSYPFTEAVYAMGKNSPAAANHVAQYMANHVAMRASAPAFYSSMAAAAVDGDSRLGGSSRYNSKTNNDRIVAKKKDSLMMSMIHQYRRSTGQNVYGNGIEGRKRSSFLQRAPVGEIDVYGGGF